MTALLKFRFFVVLFSKLQYSIVVLSLKKVDDLQNLTPEKDDDIPKRALRSGSDAKMRRMLSGRRNG